jgi:hypothetical protein
MAVNIKQLIAPSLVPNTEQTFYTCPASTSTVFRALNLYNNTAGAVDVEFWIVPTGQSTGNDYLVAKKSVSGTSASRVTEVEGLVLQAGDFLVTKGTVNGGCSIIGGGVEVI